MKKQITIKDIAKEAEVSIATVSMILNNKDKSIGKATKERVLQIAKKRNYVPNIMARSLVTKKTATLGLIIPDITNPFFPEIARGTEDKASEAGYSIIYCNTDDKLKREDAYIQILTEKMVDGIIFAHSADRQGSEGLEKCRVPIVLIDRDYEYSNVKGRVLVNNEQAAFEGVSYLITRGNRKIAYIAGPMNTLTARDRLAGYKRAFDEKNLTYSDSWVKSGEYKSQWGYEATLELMDESVDAKSPEEQGRFDCIFCGNDLIAMGATRAIKESGLRIPEDIGVMGFDDIYMASMVEPPLTTIKQPNYLMGYKAAELLISILEKTAETKEQEKDSTTVFLATEIVVRKSTK